MAQNTAVQAYTPGPDIFGEEYFTEKIETKKEGHIQTIAGGGNHAENRDEAHRAERSG
jgi:hypothetical protein